MNEHETRIYNELMKLSKPMLLLMADEAEVKPPFGHVFYAVHPNQRLASKDDAARALASWMAKRDFMVF